MKSEYCQCGRFKTTQPLAQCHKCEVCGRMMHTQYHILFHPNCNPSEQKRDERDERTTRE